MRPIQEREIRTAGIIIASFQSGEHDKILRAITENFGKISIIAKRCRGTQTKTWQHTPELFDNGLLILQPPKNSSELYRLKRTSSLTTSSALTKRFDTIVLGTLLCEVVDKLTTDHHVEDNVLYVILASALKDLGTSDTLKNSLQSTYSHILDCLKLTGFHTDPSISERGSLKQFYLLLTHVEKNAESVLNSRSSAEMLLEQLKKQHLR